MFWSSEFWLTHSHRNLCCFSRCLPSWNLSRLPEYSMQYIEKHTFNICSMCCRRERRINRECKENELTITHPSVTVTRPTLINKFARVISGKAYPMAGPTNRRDPWGLIIIHTYEYSTWTEDGKIMEDVTWLEACLKNFLFINIMRAWFASSFSNLRIDNTQYTDYFINSMLFWRSICKIESRTRINHSSIL